MTCRSVKKFILLVCQDQICTLSFAHLGGILKAKCLYVFSPRETIPIPIKDNRDEAATQ